MTLAEVIEKYKEQSGLSLQQIADRTKDVPKNTINNWIKGTSKGTRSWYGLVQFASALQLSIEQIDEILAAAKHPPMEELLQQSLPDHERSALAFWREAEEHALNQLPRVGSKKFVGREQEIVTILNALKHGARNCAITGMGGIGKSALAIESAYLLQNFYTDGILYARLNGTASLAAIIASFCEAFGRDVTSYAEVADRARVMREVLANKQVLVVLDNVESADELMPLLPPRGYCGVLITTRNTHVVRNVDSVVVELTPLSLEDGEELLQAFIGKKRFKKENAGVQTLLSLVSGLPLALNLAASTLAQNDYITVLEYAELLADKSERLDSLVDFDDESKSVRTSFEVSFQYLDSAAQQLFATLAVFDGLDFSADAVSKITRQSPVKIKLLLSKLTARSMIEVSDIAQQHEVTNKSERLLTERYRLHALMHLFAQEKFAASAADLRARAVTYFVELAERYQQGDYHWLDADWQNIEAALRWAHTNNKAELLLRGVHALTKLKLGVVGFLDSRGYWQAARQMLNWLPDDAQASSYESALGQFKQAVFAYRLGESAEKHLNDSTEQLRQLAPSAQANWLQVHLKEFKARINMQGEKEIVLAELEEAIELLDQLDTKEATYFAGYLQVIKAEAFGRMGDLKQAAIEAEQGLQKLPSVEENPTSAHLAAFTTLGNIYNGLPDLEKSVAVLEQGIKLAVKLGDVQREAGLRTNYGNALQWKGETKQALAEQQQAFEIYERIGDLYHAGSVRINLAMIYMIWGKFESAHKQLNEVIRLGQEKEWFDLVAFGRVTLADLYIQQQSGDKASEQLAFASELSRHHRIALVLPSILISRTELHLHLGNYDQGVITAKQTIAEASGKELGMALSQLGRLYDAQHRYAEAQSAHDKAFALLEHVDAYEFVRCLLAMVSHYAASGDHDLAGNYRKDSRILLNRLSIEEPKKEILLEK